MSIAVCLLLYAVLVSVVAPRLLPHLTGRGRPPRTAVAAWLIVMASVLASWVSAAGVLAVDVARTWQQPSPMDLAACLARVLSITAGDALWLHTGLAAAALMLAAVVTVRVCRMLLRASECGRRHAESARLVGRRVAGVDGVVIDTPEQAVYCVGGRSGTVVVTTAALAALPSRALDAVLAHERAHAHGRHHLLLAVTQALATTMPRVRLFTVAHAEIARLLEMCADDVAGRRHGAPALLSAILTLAGCAPVPAGTLGATGVGVAARVARLAEPGTSTQRWRTRLFLAFSASVVVAAPLWMAASGVGACMLFAASQ